VLLVLRDFARGPEREHRDFNST